MKQHPQLYLQCENPTCLIYFEHNSGKRKRWCSDKCKMQVYRASKKESKS